MNEFRFQSLPWNIVSGVNSIHSLPAELESMGLTRALVLCTPAQHAEGQRVVDLLENKAVGLYDKAAMHVPMATVDEALQLRAQLAADCSVAIGGGSTTGLGKALALKTGLKNIVIPTSYAGSEMTNVWGITQDGRKTTGRDNRVVPDLTIYDPTLTLTMPPSFAASSGLNAIAQAAVNIATDNVSPMVEALALEAVRRLAGALPVVLEDPDNLEARAQAQIGASMAGSALGTGTTGLHHRLCHTFGGTFGTPHAETHTVLLPYSIAYNSKAAAAGTAKLAQALNCANAPDGLQALAKRLGAPSSLAQLNIKKTDLDRAAQLTLSSPLQNPEPVTVESVRHLLEYAFEGKLPSEIKAA